MVRVGQGVGSPAAKYYGARPVSAKPAPFSGLGMDPLVGPIPKRAHGSVKSGVPGEFPEGQVHRRPSSATGDASTSFRKLAPPGPEALVDICEWYLKKCSGEYGAPAKAARYLYDFAREVRAMASKMVYERDHKSEAAEDAKRLLEEWDALFGHTNTLDTATASVLGHALKGVSKPVTPAVVADRLASQEQEIIDLGERCSVLELENTKIRGNFDHEVALKVSHELRNAHLAGVDQKLDKRRSQMGFDGRKASADAAAVADLERERNRHRNQMLAVTEAAQKQAGSYAERMREAEARHRQEVAALQDEIASLRSRAARGRSAGGAGTSREDRAAAVMHAEAERLNKENHHHVQSAMREISKQKADLHKRAMSLFDDVHRLNGSIPKTKVHHHPHGAHAEKKGQKPWAPAWGT